MAESITSATSNKTRLNLALSPPLGWHEHLYIEPDDRQMKVKMSLIQKEKLLLIKISSLLITHLHNSSVCTLRHLFLLYKKPNPIKTKKCNTQVPQSSVFRILTHGMRNPIKSDLILKSAT